MSRQGAEGQPGQRMVRWIAGSFGKKEEGEQELAAAVTVENSAAEEQPGAEELLVAEELPAAEELLGAVE